MKKNKKTTNVFVSAFLLICILFTACGVNIAVDSITISKLPDITEYFVGDTFSAVGGEILVKYNNGEVKNISMTADGVDISTANTATTGTKSVTVTFGGKRDRFNITVHNQTFEVIFNLNYIGAPLSETKTVIKGDTVFTADELENIIDPIRENFIFSGWFLDSECTQPYNFADQVADNLELFANWMNESATYYKARFDHNYYGVLESSIITLNVEEGNAVQRPTVSPTRIGYEFVNWYTDAECTTLYDFKSTFNYDKIIYAKWNKTHLGVKTWLFEAEDVDLTGKRGPGISSESGGTSMIVDDYEGEFGTSNNRFVSYLYKKADTTTIEFYIVSDIDVSNVTFTARLAMEVFSSYTFTPENYIIEVNGISVLYPSISFTTVNDRMTMFRDCILTTTLSLNKGQNVIKFITNNVLAEPVSTMVSAAPCIDCIKFTATDAVLIWDGAKNLPKAYNYY